MDYHDFARRDRLEKELPQSLHFWYRARLRLIKRLLHIAVGGVKQLRILDVGCGTGTELPLLMEAGDVTALDMHEDALRIASSAGCATLCADISNHVLPQAAYDIVCAFDVLEHIKNDEKAIQNIFKTLAPGGTFVLTVPAYQALFSEHDAALEHERRYERREIIAKLQRAGFEIRLLRYWNSILFPIVAFLRLVKRWGMNKKRGSAASEVRPVSPAMDSMLFQLLSFESAWMRYTLPFGLSMAIVARKPS